MEQFVGNWKLIGYENLNEYLTALGVNDHLKPVAYVVKPKLTIFQEGDTVVINLDTGFPVVGGQKASFKLGEEFQMKTLDGRDCKVVVNLEGDKLIEVSKWNQSESTIIYEIKDGQLIKTLTYGDAVAVSIYKKGLNIR